MKGMLKGVAVLALAAVVGASSANAQGGAKFGIGGGVTLPLGDFSDVAKLGFNGQVSVGFQPASLPIGIQVDGNFIRNSFKSDVSADGHTQIIAGTVNGVYTFKTAATSSFHPYIIAGPGVYNVKVDVTDFGSESSTKFGVNAGAGFNFMMGGAGAFIEGRFHDVFTSGGSTQFVNVDVGVRFGGR